MPDKIVVVEDEPEIADLIEVYLKNENYTVLSFIQGVKPLNLLIQQRLILRFWILCCRISMVLRFVSI